MKKFIFSAVLFAFALIPAKAQTAAPATLSVNIGASTLGLMGPATVPGTDVVARFTVKGNVSLRSDNILAPGANFQGYFGGVQYPLGASLLAKTNLKQLDPYVTGSVGVDRIVAATGPSQAHIAFLAGGGLNWKPASGGLEINLVEVRYARLPGFASNTAIVSGGISYFFGK
ncbi:MAG: hypothetical protein ACRD2O_00155 [Terriglobia bacterium]